MEMRRETKEACGAKAPRSPFVLSLSDFQLVSLSVFVSRVCAPTLPLTNIMVKTIIPNVDKPTRYVGLG